MLSRLHTVAASNCRGQAGSNWDSGADFLVFARAGGGTAWFGSLHIRQIPGRGARKSIARCLIKRGGVSSVPGSHMHDLRSAQTHRYRLSDDPELRDGLLAVASTV